MDESDRRAPRFTYRSVVLFFFGALCSKKMTMSCSRKKERKKEKKMKGEEDVASISETMGFPVHHDV